MKNKFLYKELPSTNNYYTTKNILLYIMNIDIYFHIHFNTHKKIS